ncbi:EAL domain-containing protein [Anaerobacillus sp. CMMVII]|uniref:EAL domain-containing protein n=1 Tax=Anaerobacillus sp. CMMVII TaxID=2755588 RepID=UPI0021B764B3|nr:EAL domain-containing protein [Anaerobacillus sp. CMMVII]MCT8138470.1 EAL domain-containing protein [Anaerobacillus sp. CMMVII]
MKQRDDGRFEYVQVSAQAIVLANLPEDALGQCLQDIYSEEIATPLHEKYSKAVKSGQSVTYIEPMNLKNNAQFKMAESTLVPVIINKANYVIAFIKDVTELENKKYEVFEQKERFHSLFSYNNDSIIATDVEGTIQLVNKAFTSSFQIAENQVIDRTITELFPTLSVFGESPKTIPLEEEVLLELHSITVIALVKRIPIIIEEKNIGFYFILKDITSNREMILTNKELERYKKLLELSPQMIFLVKRGAILYINNVGLQLLKTRRSSVIGKDISSFVKEEIGSFLKEGDMATIKKSNGETLYVTLNKTVVFLNKEKIFLYSITDITNQLAIEKELDFMENYDLLTGLYNRKSLDQLIELQMTTGQAFHLVLFNIDKFKLVNDLIGVTNADEILKQFAFRLKNLTDDQSLARVNGDEFAILLPQEKPINSFLDKIQQDLSAPFDTVKGPIHITASAAISKFPDHGDQAEQLYLSATKAMSIAKIRGVKQVLYYQEEMQEAFTRKYLIENELKLSFRKKHFHIAYQPKVHLKGKPLELEALIRWEHPTLGLISPAEFIPIAEDSGFIIELGKFVIDQVCHDLQKLHKTYPELRMAINLSPKQFLDPELEASIFSVIDKYQLEPSFIEFEITETTIMSDPNMAIHILNSLKNAGITIAIDDFGTSFSSFNYLKRLPVDTIKIDRSFINGIGENEKDNGIVEGLIDLAHKMNLTITAEGVETKEQLQFLQAKKCDFVQGFFLGRPQKLEVLVTSLQQINHKLF